MQLKRHQKFLKDVEEEWSKKFITFIKANPDKPWNWHWISGNPNITMDIIKANPLLPWDWDSISSNPNITMEMIKENPDKPWDWNYVF